MTLPALAVDSVSIVVRGSFNPAIFSPAWLLSQSLIGQSEYDSADVESIRNDVALFETGWLRVQSNRTALQLLTEAPDEFERARDAMIGILRTLQHVPVSVLGINRQVHFPVENVDRWHAIGDTVAPKGIWEGVIKVPGLRLLNIEGVREDKYGGRINVQIEPSQSIRGAVYVAVNDHYQLETVESSPETRDELFVTEARTIEPSPERIPLAIEILSHEWSASMHRAEAIIERVSSVGGAVT